MELETSRIEKRLEEVFAEFGQRNSVPRQLLSEEFSHLALSGIGFTAEELWHRLRAINQGIGRATIFRAVKKLVEMDVLDCIDFSDGTRLYRVCGERIGEGHSHHHHLACTQCHKIVDFHFCLPQEQLSTIGRQEHFRIEGHSLTVYGLCEECQKGNLTNN